MNEINDRYSTSLDDSNLEKELIALDGSNIDQIFPDDKKSIVIGARTHIEAYFDILKS
ncbi:hypothetical protein KAI54_02820 [Candidatus Gracilibacteria bacterium]|nr:hypothetical protein [Candidatus Gracilibacteria bacterium]